MRTEDCANYVQRMVIAVEPLSHTNLFLLNCARSVALLVKWLFPSRASLHSTVCRAAQDRPHSLTLKRVTHCQSACSVPCAQHGNDPVSYTHLRAHETDS